MAKTQSTRYKCDDCGQLCRSEVGLTRHVKAKHKSKRGEPSKDDRALITTVGRPTDYSDELAAKFCAMIAIGYSLRTACKEEDMPAPTTIYVWLRQHKEFNEQYARACEERTEAMAEDILDIADDGTNDYMMVTKGDQEFEVLNSEHLQRSRLRIDTRKWLMSKVKPTKFGDKLDVTSDGKPLPTPIYGGNSGKSTTQSK